MERVHLAGPSGNLFENEGMKLNPLHQGHEPEMFPTLDAEQIEQVRRYGGEDEELADGQFFCREGDQDFDFAVVLEGALEVFHGPPDRPQPVVVHPPGKYFGDVHSLSGRAAVVSCRAQGRSRILRLPARALRQLVIERSTLSDVLLSSFLHRRLALIAGNYSSKRLIGSRYCSNTHRLREFLTRNSQPFVWLDLEKEDEIESLLQAFGLRVQDTPVVILSSREILRNPSNEELAEKLGLNTLMPDRVVDVLVVGSGPAGLAATVYAASEGLEVLTLDSSGPGGQAGTSSKIENYLGFPTGISGRDLADRALLQAQKFGAKVASARTAQSVDCSKPVYSVTTCDGAQIHTRSIVIATGARYRKLELPNLAHLEGRGIFYGATAMECQLCRDGVAVVVGGGNSAGQAVVFLSGIAREVHLHVRGDGLAASMSKYLIRRIEETPNIFLHTHSEVSQLHGEEHLEKVSFHCRRTGQSSEIETSHLFSMVGAQPNTDWICEGILRDDKGFVLTGRDLSDEQLRAAGWTANRRPYPYETSRPRVFAVGDVRSDSTKRVATAVGEGSAAVSFLHRALASLA